MYKYFIRKFLFLFDPEKVHHFTFSFLKFVFKLPLVKTLVKKGYGSTNASLKINVLGLNFKNPVGLAAGFDKNALLFDELSYLGFGFVEIGTVTPKPQAGNPKKRLFRLKRDQGIINRMGFNNDGVEVVVERLKNRKTDVIIGGNIGKNKITPNENAVDDYLICFNVLFDWVDYFVVNVSSPNTPNLRDLQEKEPLTKLLNRLQVENDTKIQRKPILLKIAPDLSNDQLLDIIDIVEITKIDGLIATNTTISREGLVSENKKETGGLSGKPLSHRSTEVIKFLTDHAKNPFPIIGVGGIHSEKDALDKLKAGAKMVQLYTGFIYEGPNLVKRINKKFSEEKEIQ